MNPDTPVEVKIEELLKGRADYGKLELLRDARHRIIELRTYINDASKQTAAMFEELADIVEDGQFNTEEVVATIRHFAAMFKQA